MSALTTHIRFLPIFFNFDIIQSINNLYMFKKIIAFFQRLKSMMKKSNKTTSADQTA